jgi:hypothetical protein
LQQQTQTRQNQVQNGLIKIARTGLYKIDFTGTYYTSVVADDYDASQWSIPTSKSVGYSLLRNGQEIATSFNVESGDMPNVSGTDQELSNTINFSGEYFFNAGDEIDFRVSVFYQVTMGARIFRLSKP